MIKISVKSAKRMGFAIKGYVFVKNYKTPIPVIEKRKVKKVKQKKIKKEDNKIKLKKEGLIYKLDLENLKGK